VSGTEVTIVDYGLGNLYSVTRALVYLGAKPELASDPERIASAHHVILPGVGAFGDGMKNLRERRFVEPLRAHASAGKPLLGICLGMQLLFTRSDEFGSHEGLGILPGDVVAIPEDLGVKVPHIGWNRLEGDAASWKGTLLEGIEPGSWVYFVHSFAVAPARTSTCLATTTYGGHAITAVARAGTVSGCQFHPEVSATAGLAILERFLAT
jgi:imidazole glycerol-phosphate synthase subunit HisH